LDKRIGGVGTVPEFNDSICQVTSSRLLVQPLDVKIYPRREFRDGILLIVPIEFSPENRRALRHLTQGLAQEIVFRPKFPVKRHFVGLSGFRNSIDANPAYAKLPKQIRCA
jgi:hypothetical protein